MKAAEYAGLNVLTLIKEPNAVGLAFGLQDQNTKPKYVFVFDFWWCNSRCLSLFAYTSGFNTWIIINDSLLI